MQNSPAQLWFYILNPLHEDKLGLLHTLTSLKLMRNGKKGSSREGTMTIPIANVVTVHVDKVDRGHTDPKRYVY